MPTQFDFLEGAAARFNDQIEASILNGVGGILIGCAEEGDYADFKEVFEQAHAKFRNKLFSGINKSEGMTLSDAVTFTAGSLSYLTEAQQQGKKQIFDYCLAQSEAIIKPDVITVMLCRYADLGDFESFRDLFNTARTKFPESIGALLNGKDEVSDTPFICAIDPDMAFPDPEAKTPMPSFEKIAAALEGTDRIIEFCFMQPELDINMAGENETTPIMWANEVGRVTVSLKLYDRSDLITDCADEYGDTDLITAVESHIPEVVAAALKREKANVRQTDNEEESALSYAQKFVGDSTTVQERIAAAKILDLVKGHPSYTPTAPEQPTEGVRAAKKRAARGLTEPQPLDISSSSTADEAQNGEFKSEKLRAMAAANPRSHSLALLHWIDNRGGNSLEVITQQIKHEGKGLRVPTLLKYIQSSDLYADGGRDRTSYDPKFHSISQHIGYDPTGDYPLQSGTGPSVSPTGASPL